MVYKFRIISDEVDDFLREIDIDSEASFYDLHEAILKSTGYKNDQMTSFFICDDDWEKETEITLEDMGNGSSEEDTYVMKATASIISRMVWLVSALSTCRLQTGASCSMVLPSGARISETT